MGLSYQILILKKVKIMKKFNHKPVTLEPIKATNKDGVRLYETPDGNKYPSITTVLSVRNKQGLFEWRKRVGEDVANYIARTAAARGTAVHHMCEDYLNNEDMEKHKKNFLPHALFTQMRDNLLHRIDNIHSQECGLYSDKYRVAGRVDCIAEFDGKLSIIDFKTSTKERKDEYNESYYSCSYTGWSSPRVCKRQKRVFTSIDRNHLAMGRKK